MSDSTHTECQETNSELESKRLHTQLDQERQRREQAEGLLRESRSLAKRGFPAGEWRQSALRLMERIDKHFGEWDG